MNSWGIVSEIWSWLQSAGTIAAVGLAAKFYLDRRKLLLAENGGDWKRLRDEIDRLDGRCDHLQKEVDECRKREGEWMARAIAAEGALQGQGEVRQRASEIVAADRLARDAEKRGKAKNGE